MIAYIRGKLTNIHEETIVIDVGGIGYEIQCANPYDFQSSLNKELFIHTYHHVREDAQILYGFKTVDEKYLFTKLISVSGIGPKSGMNIQGSVNVSEFVAAVEQEDEKYLMSFPGVGKKTARQIILDLKGKLSRLATVVIEDQPTKESANETTSLKEAQEALGALGYSSQEIRAIIPELQKHATDHTDELIRKALALLVKN